MWRRMMLLPLLPPLLPCMSSCAATGAWSAVPAQATWGVIPGLGLVGACSKGSTLLLLPDLRYMVLV